MNAGPLTSPLPLNGAEEHPATLVSRWWSRYEELSGGAGGPAQMELFARLLLLNEAHRRALAHDDPQRTALGAAAGAWRNLVIAPDSALVDTYQQAVVDLATEHTSALGGVFTEAAAPIDDSVLLRTMIDDLGHFEESLGPDDGDAGGHLLNALLEHLTIRSAPPMLLDAVVSAVQPRYDDVIADPACGSGGFLIAAQRYIEEQTPGLGPLLTGAVIESVKSSPLAGLAFANVLLHSSDWSGDRIQITSSESFDLMPTSVASLVLSNPPFGRSLPAMEPSALGHPDFAVRTNSQVLNHLQHTMASLACGGRAAVVLPDNVLFEAGAAERLRRILLDDFEFHTLVRLPTGVFREAVGVRANVLFFDRPAKGVPSPATRHLWVYDMRPAAPAGRKERPAGEEDFAAVVQAIRAGDRAARVESPDGQFRSFAYADLVHRDDVNLDLRCSAPSVAASERRSPQKIAREIAEQLEAALVALKGVEQALPRDQVGLRGQ